MIVLLALALGGTAWRLADTKPDPNTQAIADGCQRDTTKIYTGAAPNWVYVNDRDFPSAGPPPGPRWVSGTVKGPLGLLASRVASSDDPITHHSYDVNLDVTVQRADDFLTGTSRDTTSEQGTLHLERESSSYPEWARPQAGDHVEALGSWIWDCDHYQGRGEKTEFHPVPRGLGRRGAAPRRRSRRGDAEGDLYISSDPTPAGKQAECAHRDKGSDQFKSCSHAARDWWSVNGTYRFALCAPGPRPPARPPGDRACRQGQQPEPATFGHGAQRRVRRRRRQGRAAGRQARRRRVAGLRRLVELDGEGRPPAAALRPPARAAGDGPELSRPTKPACPAKGETTLLGQIANGPGEWQLHWSVDGIWGRWPGTLAARDGSVFKGTQSVDFFVARGAAVVARHAGPRVRLRGAARAGTAPGTRTAPCPLTTEIGNSKGDDYPGAIAVTYRGRRARPPRHERLHGRLVLPAVEHARVLSADVHGYACALTGERNRHGQEPTLPSRLARRRGARQGVAEPDGVARLSRARCS